MTNEFLNRIEEYLWPRGDRPDIWMILDAARDRRIFSMLLESHLQHSCLYAGALPPDVEIAAPYLVQLDHGYRDTHRFIQHAWGESWGVFLRCDTSAAILRRHLREFLIVRDSRGNRMLFRYYDPRVLRLYLPTCNREELQAVFGPINRFWTEDELAQNLLEYGLDQSKLVTKILPIKG